LHGAQTLVGALHPPLHVAQSGIRALHRTEAPGRPRTWVCNFSAAPNGAGDAEESFRLEGLRALPAFGGRPPIAKGARFDKKRAPFLRFSSARNDRFSLDSVPPQFLGAARCAPTSALHRAQGNALGVGPSGAEQSPAQGGALDDLTRPQFLGAARCAPTKASQGDLPTPTRAPHATILPTGPLYSPPRTCRCCIHQTRGLRP